MEFWADQTFESIGDAIGRTVNVDIDYGRVKVVLDANQELVMETTMDFKAGEYHDGDEAVITLRYENLVGYCTLCNSLCHAMERCVLNPDRVEKKKEVMEDFNGKKDDRSRSYKGVVVHGNGGNQEKEKEKREYGGKGKDKGSDEQGTKWAKAGNKDNKRSYQYRGVQRKDEGSSRDRHNQREEERNQQIEKSERAPRGIRRGRSPQGMDRGEEKEEGEIKEKEQSKGLEEEQPSLAFKLALLDTQADPMDTVQTDMAQQSVVLKVTESSDTGMEVENETALFVDQENDDVGENSGLLLSESELAEFGDSRGEEVNMEKSTLTGNGEVMVQQPLEQKLKMQGSKKTSKPPTGLAGSNKLRMAQGLASPRRRTWSRVNRQCESMKKQEDKKVEEKGVSESTKEPKPT